MVEVRLRKELWKENENGDEFYVVTVAYSSETYTGDLTMDATESIHLAFFHPNELPTPLVKSHEKILKEFLAWG
ncbi:NUDIX hydrolase [Virgibacillus halodenitrificans]|uniref:hypothetical protein n=1 Tax=Virgibacillus halodenitrificans TaxID=1482 RepID=UPI000B03820F|nr:hypothetical protein [Virgibacillus halodenitrificans]